MPSLIPTRERSLSPETELEERLVIRLREATGGALRSLRIATIGGQVSIWGMAPSYHSRQIAEAAARTILPADRLQIEIEVEPLLRWHELETAENESGRHVRPR